MNIFFDYSIFFHQTHGGISRYFINLHNIIKNKGYNTEIISPIHINKFLKDYRYNSNKNIYIKNFPLFTRKILKFYNKKYSNIYCKLKKPDIIHKTFYNNNFDNNKKIKKIITVYDLIHEIYYKDFNLKDKYPKKNILKQVDFIICPSQKTKKDLVEYYNFDKDRIEVVYMGIQKFEETASKYPSFIDDPFILFVGDRKRYKNFINFIKACSISKKILNDFNIICFGGGAFRKDEVNMINELNINKKKLLQLDGDDSILGILYKKATAMIFPSSYEGLGLPQLEAMSMGCPVISSNHEAILEATGDAVVNFDPHSSEDIAYKIENTIYSEDKLKKLRQIGIERSKLFSWEKCAEETIKIYKKVLNN